MTNARGLSPTFMLALQNDLQLGINRFLQAVKKDHTLCLEIRENYITIYYRGGQLIQIKEKNERFSASFDRRYIQDPDQTAVPSIVKNDHAFKCFDEVTTWIKAIPFLKQEMDWHFGSRPKNEREFQQLMERENNFGETANGTDYFICDIEYANKNGRFDLIAAHWPSTSTHRKDNKNVGLAFIELKYMNKAMARSSGIQSHIRDMQEYFTQNQDHFAAIKEEMRTVFNQKVELGLIDNPKPIESFDQETPDFIFAFANHDPASAILIREIQAVAAIADTLPFKIKFAVSNFMGYGLYEQNVYGLEEFMERFSKQIFTGGVEA